MFFKIERWNFQHLFEIKFCETSQNFNSFSLFRQLLFSFSSMGCLIELKFCEVSRNSCLNRCWKFQLPILKNKKVLFLKKCFLVVVNIKTKKGWFWFQSCNSLYLLLFQLWEKVHDFENERDNGITTQILTYPSGCCHLVLVYHIHWSAPYQKGICCY